MRSVFTDTSSLKENGYLRHDRPSKTCCGEGPEQYCSRARQPISIAPGYPGVNKQIHAQHYLTAKTCCMFETMRRDRPRLSSHVLHGLALQTLGAIGRSDNHFLKRKSFLRFNHFLFGGPSRDLSRFDQFFFHRKQHSKLLKPSFVGHVVRILAHRCQRLRQWWRLRCWFEKDQTQQNQVLCCRCLK